MSLMRDYPLDTRSPGAPRSKNAYYCITCVIFSSNEVRIVHLRGGGGSLCQLVSAGQGPKGGMFSSTRETNTSKKPSDCRDSSMLCFVKAFPSCVVGLLGCFFLLCEMRAWGGRFSCFYSRYCAGEVLALSTKPALIERGLLCDSPLIPRLGLAEMAGFVVLVYAGGSVGVVLKQQNPTHFTDITC